MQNWRKILIIGSTGIVALGLVAIALSFGGKSRIDVYSSSNPDFLKADFRKQPKESFDEWEKQILSRNPTNQSANVGTAGGNYTQQLAQGVFEEYFRAKQLNTEVSEDKIVADVLARSLPESYEVEYEEYRASDLKVIADNSSGALKNYGNKLGEAAAKNVYNASSGTEMEILMRATQFDREKEFEKLRPIIKSYGNFIEDLLKIETPTELAGIHLNIVNSVSQIKSAVEEFNLFLKDPARGLFVVGAYGEYILDLQDYIIELGNLMKEGQINFEEDEPGFHIQKIYSS